MTTSDLIKQLFLSFHDKDSEAFFQAARTYIEHEKRKKHTIIAKELEKALYTTNGSSDREKRFKNTVPIPRDTEKGFPLLEIQNFDISLDSLLVSAETKQQLEQIIREFKDADVFATYNLTNKRKILLCGKPGTGKTFSARIVSSVLQIPLVYVRFDSIISSYLGETASNLRKALFEFYLRPIKKASDINLQKAVSMTQGLSPADIKMVTEEAMKLSILDSRHCIEQKDIEDALKKFSRREKVKNNQMGD